MSSCLTSIEENRGLEKAILGSKYIAYNSFQQIFIRLTKPFIKTSCSLFNLIRLWTTSSKK